MSELNESMVKEARDNAARFKDLFDRITGEVHKYIVGQEEVVAGVLAALVCRGHVLLEGVPGIGKTMLVQVLSRVLELDFSRIQFTPDMLPADILGADTLEEDGKGGHHVVFRQGPIVANLLLADEINRATPRTQSAMLEAMQERQVTVGRKTYRLPEPFVVCATQNPIEQEGTYPLPEAQMDRFLCKIKVGYPQESDYAEIIKRTTMGNEPEIERIAGADEINWMATLAQTVPVPEQVMSWCTRLVMATQPGTSFQTKETEQFVQLGASPRGVQGLVAAGRVMALRAGAPALACAHVRAVALSVLRHRLVLDFEARAEGIDADQVIQAALDSLPETTV